MSPAQRAFPRDKSRRFGLHAYCYFIMQWALLDPLACLLLLHHTMGPAQRAFPEDK